MQYAKLQIGRAIVRAPIEVTQRYECAAWHQTILCPPGEYPVYAYLSACNIAERYLGHTLYAAVRGPITSACFVSRIGAHYGSDEGPKMVGREDEGSIQFATFMLGDYVARGELALDESLVSRKSVSGEGREVVMYSLSDAGQQAAREAWPKERW